ncbi:MAG: DUF1365 domain-containing protein [Gammaproteobacteria bacterium]|nr:DUF1365 domain-containing protein [Gammaproteobacteria bacterium]MYF59401.1 DUF1365 domain-containing protein [Gammaproteobacteria bacterium]
MHSAIYEGWVRHIRHRPARHAFQYRLFMAYVDLDELDQVFSGRWLWSTRRPAIARFLPSDHLDGNCDDLAEGVRALVRERSGLRLDGPVRLLTHLRYFGYIFNPISVYYCFDRVSAKPRCYVLEVSNTPWKERVCYVLPVTEAKSGGRGQVFEIAKEMHVSPFIPMDMSYRCWAGSPGERLSLSIEVLREDEATLQTSLALTRRPVTGDVLARSLLRYPLMTANVTLRIHLNALRLWLKGVKPLAHPGS